MNFSTKNLVLTTSDLHTSWKYSHLYPGSPSRPPTLSQLFGCQPPPFPSFCPLQTPPLCSLSQAGGIWTTLSLPWWPGRLVIAHPPSASRSGSPRVPETVRLAVTAKAFLRGLASNTPKQHLTLSTFRKDSVLRWPCSHLTNFSLATS